MPVVNCPNCGDPVEIDRDWYGRRIACPNCDHRFTPREEGRGRGRDDEDDRPRRRSRRDDEYDDGPRRRRSRYDDGPPPKKSGGVMWLVLILVGVFVGLPCVGCVGFFVWANTAKESFTGPWADQSVGPDGGVTAAFPKPATTEYVNVAGSSGSEVVGFDNSGGGTAVLDAKFVAGYVEFPRDGGGDPLTKHLPAIRTEMEDRFIADEFTTPSSGTESMTTVNGYPAREVTYNQEDGGYTLRVVHVNDRPPGSPVRLVVVVVGGPHLKPEDKQKFLNSVRFGKR